MNLDLQPLEADLLRELIETKMAQLRFEIARADSRDYKHLLERRHEALEEMLRRMPLATT